MGKNKFHLSFLTLCFMSLHQWVNSNRLLCVASQIGYLMQLKWHF